MLDLLVSEMRFLRLFRVDDLVRSVFCAGSDRTILLLVF